MSRILGTSSLGTLVEEALTISDAEAVDGGGTGPPEGVVGVGQAGTKGGEWRGMRSRNRGEPGDSKKKQEKRYNQRQGNS